MNSICLPGFRVIFSFFALFIWLVDECVAQLPQAVVVEAEFVKSGSKVNDGDRTEDWCYEFTLTNSGRDDFKNFEVHYRIFHYSELGPDGKPETELEYDQDFVLVPELKSRSTVTAKSREMTFALGDSRAQARDSVKAIWVRVVDEASVEIGGLKPLSSIVKKFKWEEPITFGSVDRKPAESDSLLQSPSGPQPPGVLDTENAAIKKMRLIIIPIVNFEDTPLGDAIQYLNEQSVLYDDIEPDPTKRGVRIKLGSVSDPAIPERKVNLRLHETTLSEALRYTTSLVWMKFQKSGDDIEVVPLSPP